MTTRAPGVLISNVCPLGIFSMNEKELIKTSGIWQGGNDWRSPLPWLPQLAHRATCYPSTPASTPRYNPVHPGTTQYTPVHLQCYKQRRGKVRQKDRTRATDAAMPINGGARELAHQETHWLLATPSNWHICHSNHCSVFYTQVSFIEDHLFWMTTQQQFGCTPKQKGSQHNTLVGLTWIVSLTPRCKRT